MSGSLTVDSGPGLEALGRRERAGVVAGIAVVAGLCWAYTVQMARAMAPACGVLPLASPHCAPWGGFDAGMTLAMWTVMMAAMMLPTAVPVALTLAAVNRSRGEAQGPLVAVGWFLAGYLAVWTGYSAAATLGQWGLHEAALLSPSTLATGPVLGGALLVAAGLFQLSPWKEACMVHCRSPLGFLLARWRSGRLGAWWMGVRFGGYCVGCCWLLMVLSFALGVMNLLWMAALTLFMLAEKLVPEGRGLSRVAGVLLAASGAGMMWGGTFH